MAKTHPMSLVRGKTFQQAVRWETDPVIYKAISAISIAGGPPRLTVTGHGIPSSGWRVAVTRALGMKQINADNAPPRDSDYHEVTVIDASTLELNGLTPVDDTGREWPAYTGGGFIQYNTPHDLTGYTCDVVIKDRIGGSVLASSRASDAPLNLITATVDAANKAVVISMSAANTAAVTWKKGVWEVEMRAPDSTVYPLVSPSPVVVSDEVAT